MGPLYYSWGLLHGFYMARKVKRPERLKKQFGPCQHLPVEGNLQAAGRFGSVLSKQLGLDSACMYQPAGDWAGIPWIRIHGDRPNKLQIVNAFSFGACIGGAQRTEGLIRLHCYIRLQGQLSGNTEACNQSWPKNAHLIILGLGRRGVGESDLGGAQRCTSGMLTSASTKWTCACWCCGGSAARRGLFADTAVANAQLPKGEAKGAAEGRVYTQGQGKDFCP
eukprot:1139273-Pelagomonas_calceolata.AAC.1